MSLKLPVNHNLVQITFPDIWLSKFATGLLRRVHVVRTLQVYALLHVLSNEN